VNDSGKLHRYRFVGWAHFNTESDDPFIGKTGMGTMIDPRRGRDEPGVEDLLHGMRAAFLPLPEVNSLYKFTLRL